ncbi:hypothetical protein EV11_0614 [Prochlorococcus sp. SS52]|nr:hypothetical protein EV04_1284 [Prochlorococcus marinus str. LG]KGG21547.1 hypothetical protein EV08_0634 [Prochlorococcus marinus str. SS2]KGG23110.1 hypothetical protein EV09_1856 [Prochlorococcus marinus str. SS35]KGG33820.1 hypothetical protein EV10_0257 [Prochlorococcus marinus str. SS51]KGG36832.1 hypothetical protein EV11_0614 [Prochlorococcus sp. SS52]
MFWEFDVYMNIDSLEQQFQASSISEHGKLNYFIFEDEQTIC